MKIDMHLLAQEIGITENDYKRLFNTFIKETKRDLAELQNYIKKEDYHNIKIIAHHIKGSAINMGFTDLADIVLVIEHEAQKKDKDTIDKIEKLEYDPPGTYHKNRLELLVEQFNKVFNQLEQAVEVQV